MNTLALAIVVTCLCAYLLLQIHNTRFPGGF